ncbi:type VI secretion protein [Streptomyces sp. Tu 2975]|uniref:type VI secretion protein n=1 Tax=Streptomyces sp. Tu 2975 TaxID=2676871 RepID=UPI00135C993D|nr:type VI secretion protein [Streptomyces sp. Tu 2975]QIP85765.1 type VI secretion protein [Streptomyces sp. Tu 2975]
MYEGRQGQGGGRSGERQGGIPDGLLVGLLAFLLGLTLLVWSATGLAGLFAHGAWPTGVTFGNTPVAVRELAAAPHDLAGAWPATPPAQLSGYGLFWGLLIGQLMVLIVLTVFTLGTVARWRAVRAAAHEERGRLREQQPPREQRPRHEAPVHAQVASEAAPVPAAAPAADTPVEAAVATPLPTVPAPRTRTPRVLYGDRTVRRPAAVQGLLDAEGPALVVTSDPTVWADTKDARAKLGPVLVYDPGHLCDTPARLHWSPTAHCEDDRTAAARASAVLAPVRPRALIDATMADTAETLLRCWLHAAAVDGRPFRQVHRWAQGTGVHEPVRILRTHPKATAGLAGLLESALTAHPERREVARQLAVRALSALSSVHIREACTPNRTDSLALESFVNEAGTLYVVGEPIEDPRTHPGAMPLLTALAADVVEHGRRMAARSSDGRLDPPMTLVLDDVAAVAPLPRLPELLAMGQDLGLPTLALLRSPEQARARWQDALPAH